MRASTARGVVALRLLLLPLAVLSLLLAGGTLGYRLAGGNPTPEAVLEARDVLITLGHRQQLDRLEALARRTA